MNIHGKSGNYNSSRARKRQEVARHHRRSLASKHFALRFNIDATARVIAHDGQSALFILLKTLM